MTEETVAEEVAEAVPTQESTRVKRVTKHISDEGVAVVQVNDGHDNFVTACELDLNDLSDEVRDKLMGHGALAKLGDAAAGKDGQDAVDAVSRVAEQLKNGEWSVRRQSDTVRVSKSDIGDKLAEMTPEAQEKARAVMAKLGLSL